MEQLLQHCFIDSEGTCIEYCKYSSMGAPRVADASCQCIRAAKTRCCALEHFGGLMHALVLSLSSGWRSLTVQAKPAAHPPAEARQCIYSKLNNPAFAVIYRTLTFLQMISWHCILLWDGAKWFGVHSPVRVYIALCLLRSHFLQQQNTLCCSVCSFLPSLLLVLSTIAPTLCLLSHECFQPPRVVFFVSLSPIGQDEKHWASIVLQLNDEVSNALCEFLKSKAFRGPSGNESKTVITIIHLNVCFVSISAEMTNTSICQKIF